MLRDDIELLFKKLKSLLQKKLELQNRHFILLNEINHKISTEQFDDKELFSRSSDIEKSIDIENYRISRSIDKIIFITGIEKNNFTDFFEKQKDGKTTDVLKLLKESDDANREIEILFQKSGIKFDDKINKVKTHIKILNKIKNLKFKKGDFL